MKKWKSEVAARRGALVLYCASCATMVAMSIPPLAVALGIVGVRAVTTPLDGVLNVLGLPLLVASVAALLWLMRKAAKPAVGLVAAGGILTVAGMLLMGPVPGGAASPAPGGAMAMSGSSPGQFAAASGPALFAALFWVGAALLAAGYAWGWVTGRGRQVVIPLDDR